MTISYIKGDVLDFPKGILVHVCNDSGGWGKGFVINLSKKWKLPELTYRQFYYKYEKYGNIKVHDAAQVLGNIQWNQVEEDKYVVNMIAQHGYSTPSQPAIKYDHLETCLLKIASDKRTSEIHMPRIGCGLAGGTWDKIEPIIERILNQFPVFVYDL